MHSMPLEALDSQAMDADEEKCLGKQLFSTGLKAEIIPFRFLLLANTICLCNFDTYPPCEIVCMHLTQPIRAR